jgi:hypothetical protein
MTKEREKTCYIAPNPSDSNNEQPGVKKKKAGVNMHLHAKHYASSNIARYSSFVVFHSFKLPWVNGNGRAESKDLINDLLLIPCVDNGRQTRANG